MECIFCGIKPDPYKELIEQGLCSTSKNGQHLFATRVDPADEPTNFQFWRSEAKDSLARIGEDILYLVRDLSYMIGLRK